MLKYGTICRKCCKNLSTRAMRKWFWIKSGCEEAPQDVQTFLSAYFSGPDSCQIITCVWPLSDYCLCLILVRLLCGVTLVSDWLMGRSNVSRQLSASLYIIGQRVWWWWWSWWWWQAHRWMLSLLRMTNPTPWTNLSLPCLGRRLLGGLLHVVHVWLGSVNSLRNHFDEGWWQ